MLIIGQYKSTSGGIQIPSRLTFLGQANTAPPTPADINLTAAELDPRVVYTGPAHMYFNKSGLLSVSQVNEWPLEYVDGLPVGRHEPERAATNYQLDSAGGNAATSVNWARSAAVFVQVATGPSGVDGASCNSDWNQNGVFNVAGNSWVVGPTYYTPTTAWQRQIFRGNITAETRVQTHVARRDNSNYCYARSNTLPVGAFTASYFFRRLPDNRLGVALVQVESRNVATSPIITGSTTTTTRPAASVRVKKDGAATGIAVLFNNGDEVLRDFEEDGYATLTLSGRDWGSRYIKTISYRV